jgi:Uma2 family endonuclease
MSLPAFEEAEFAPGFKYEIIDGRLYVSPSPNLPENFLERWLHLALEGYAAAHPDVINYVAIRGRVYLPDRARATVPEPDLAAYADFPEDTAVDDLRWQAISPILVVEVLVGGDMAKDLTRNPELYLSLRSIREYWVLNGSESASRPVLAQHRRKGRRWEVTTFPYRSVFSTPLLPGFELVIDPHPRRRRSSP